MTLSRMPLLRKRSSIVSLMLVGSLKSLLLTSKASCPRHPVRVNCFLLSNSAQSHLDPNDCFILDCATDIFVWNGKKATVAEKSASFKRAQEFLKEKGRPAWTPITKVSQ